MDVTRREAIVSALFGAGSIGLRALATGLPMSVLLNPRTSLADACAMKEHAQYLIWATSGSGDPANANVPTGSTAISPAVARVLASSASANAAVARRCAIAWAMRLITSASPDPDRPATSQAAATSLRSPCPRTSAIRRKVAGTSAPTRTAWANSANSANSAPARSATRSGGRPAASSAANASHSLNTRSCPSAARLAARRR